MYSNFTSGYRTQIKAKNIHRLIFKRPELVSVALNAMAQKILLTFNK